MSAAPVIPPTEKHFSLKEIGKAWGLDEKSIQRIFEHEPGVLVFMRPPSKKRKYTTLRIPESVMARVHLRMLNG